MLFIRESPYKKDLMTVKDAIQYTHAPAILQGVFLGENDEQNIEKTFGHTSLDCPH